MSSSEVRTEWMLAVTLPTALRRLRRAREAFANAAGRPHRVSMASVLDLMNRDSETRSDGFFRGVKFRLTEVQK